MTILLFVDGFERITLGLEVNSQAMQKTCKILDYVQFYLVSQWAFVGVSC